MKLTTVGIDLAKNVFQVHGIDEHGKVLVKKQLRRDQMATFFVNLPPCLIGMEACGSAHHWARKLQAMGHTVRLMAPQFVKPYVKTNKNDAADAEAICEAVARPSMRFVPIKNTEQQSVLALHRVRQGFVKARTAQANQIRGLLGELGLIVPQGIGYIASRVAELIENADNELPGPSVCSSSGCSTTSRSSGDRSKSWRHRYRRGIGTATSAAGSRRCQASARSRRAPWSPPSGMRRTLMVAVSWRRGWAWSLDSIHQEASPTCWA